MGTHMTDNEFGELLARASDELAKKQSRMQADFEIGSLPRWWFDQDEEKLQFLDTVGNITVESVVVPIGSHSPASNTWKWAWSNESFLAPLRSKALPLKQLEELTGFELFAAEDAFEADEHMAWELAALGVMHLKAEACYKAPSSSGPHTFLAITSLRKVLR